MIGRVLVGIGLLGVLAVTGALIAQKERVLAEGEVVYLELGVRDPRSLVQGDYMRLWYREVGELDRWADDLPVDGHLVADLDDRGVIEDLRASTGAPLAADERPVRYRIRGGRLRVASDAWLFEEGTADAYADARYAVLRLAPDGETVLVGLADEDLGPLGPTPRRWRRSARRAIRWLREVRMSVTGTIDALLRNEHARLQHLLPQLDHTIVALQPVSMARSPTPVPQPRYAQPGARQTPQPAPTRTVTPRRLQEAWATFSQSLQGHMDKERRILMPLARSVAEGQKRFRAELGTVATQALAEHEDLRKRAAAVRGEALQLPPQLAGEELRRAVLEALELFETHTRVEEVEIYGPLCWGEDLSATPVPARWRTSDDVLKSLRTTRPDEPDDPTEDETDETSPGIFSRVKKLFGG